jgi:hypothetical protein
LCIYFQLAGSFTKNKAEGDELKLIYEKVGYSGNAAAAAAATTIVGGTAHLPVSLTSKMGW